MTQKQIKKYVEYVIICFAVTVFLAIQCVIIKIAKKEFESNKPTIEHQSTFKTQDLPVSK